jgi:glycosyltransferase involved in cell wall biosynthesis
VTTAGFLVDQLYASAPGGMGTYVRELIPALSSADPSLQITLFHARFDRPPPESWMRGYHDVELDRSIGRLYPGWAVARRPRLPDELRGASLVHSPIHVAIPPKGSGQRLVVTVHDVAFLVHPALFPAQWRWLYRVALTRAVRSADAVIAVSRHTAEELVRRTRIEASKVHVTPLAASLPAGGSPVDEVLARLKVRQPYLLFVGTLEPRKNLTRLVRAYRRMALRGLPHGLVLAGPMGWRPQALLREISAVDAPGDITLTGAVRAEDLDALYRGAEAFVYPSLYEGFGLPVLEAMARGVPCIVSTSSSLPEVAGEAAVPVDPRSVGGLADALERVITDPDLASRLRHAGVDRAARFSWDETARRTLEVYKSIL